MKDKLMSRKFWTAVSGIIIGCLMIFTDLSETGAERIAGLILVLADTMAYIFAEAHIDATDTIFKGEENEHVQEHNN